MTFPDDNNEKMLRYAKKEKCIISARRGVLSDGMALGATLESSVDATVTGNWIPDPSIQQLADHPFYYLSI